MRYSCFGCWKVRLNEPNSLVYGLVYRSKSGGPKHVWLLPEELDREFQRPAKTIARPSSRWMQWIDAAKQGTHPSCNWESGGHITEFSCFRGCDGANAMLTRDRRTGWELPAQA